jgi:formylglycine-generating enzyme required for sulfatase activity
MLHTLLVDDTSSTKARSPVIFVSWDDARAYVAWLSRMTGKAYRLLTEAEWEYAARAGTTTAYSWGDDIKKDGKAMANCYGCGSQWDGRQTSSVGSFTPNAFGLYDMAGNVYQWVQDCYHPNYDGAPTNGSEWTADDCKYRVDCYHPNYDGAPTNGSEWTADDCKYRVVRGGSWGLYPPDLRSARRGRVTSDGRDSYLGFRVGRTLTP